MELLLNILWLALLVPAVWIWRRKPAHATTPQRFGRWRPFVLLGCALILLFPVVSATDDLHAMRPEMEESSASKRLLKQSGAVKASVWATTGPFLSESIALQLGRDDQLCGLVFSAAPVPSLECAAFSQKDSRAPPRLSL